MNTTSQIPFELKTLVILLTSILIRILGIYFKTVKARYRKKSVNFKFLYKSVNLHFINFKKDMWNWQVCTISLNNNGLPLKK